MSLYPRLFENPNEITKEDKSAIGHSATATENKQEELYPKLFENPDTAYDNDNDKKYVWCNDFLEPYVFGFYQKELFIQKGGTHDSLKNNFIRFFDDKDKRLKPRDLFKYTGRLWRVKKVISFWDYPPKDYFKWVINKISEKLGENVYTAEWRVEVLYDKHNSKIEMPIDNHWENPETGNTDAGYGKFESTMIPVTDYAGSKERSREELSIQHLDTSKKHKVPFGYGSKNPKYQSKRKWQMASVTDESKNEELYPKLFENPNAINIKNIPGVKFKGITNKDEVVAWNDDTSDVITFGYDQTKTELYIGYGNKMHDAFPVYRGPCSGRIFKQYRLITFWLFPKDKEELFKLLKEIETRTKVKIISDSIPWRVEIPVKESFESDVKEKDKYGWGTWRPGANDSTYPTIFEYNKPYTRSKEELAIQHLDTSKKHEVPYGYGSKNPKYQTKRQWQMASVTDEGKQEELYPKLFENPDFGTDPTGEKKMLYYTTAGAYAFAYYKNKLKVSKENETHGHLKNETHGHFKYGLKKLERSILKYAGRIWTKQKLIAFWYFPENKEILRKIIDDLEKYFKKNYYINLDFANKDWHIEVRTEDGDQNVKLSDYIGSKQRSKEELAIQHLDTKHKHSVPYGYGSKNPKYKSKRQWQMASTTDENIFYPKLFKLNEMTESGIRDFLGTKPTSSIRIEDEGDSDVILAVDRKTKDDIITKEYIESITKIRTKQYLLDYLKEVNPEITSENVDSYKIPLGDFWQHQVELFNKTEEEKRKSSASTSSQQTYTIEKNSVDIITNYMPEDKQNTFKLFIENIPNSLIVNPINALLELLSRIILDEEEIAKARVGDEVYNLSRKQQQQWKEDLVKYLGSMHDIYELKQGDFYKSQVLNKNTFIRALFDIHATGIGKGEIMICYLFNGAASAGGDVDYDIVFVNGKNYEVKEYLDGENMSIRLGKGGKTLQFDAFNEVVDSVKTAAKLFNHYKEELISNINPMFYRLWSYMAARNVNRGSYDKAIFAAISIGELSKANLNRIIMWHYFAKDLITRGNDNISPEILKQLEGLYYVTNPESIKDDFDKTPQQYFDDNEGLDAFIIFRPDKINIAKSTDLVYATISQAGFKFIEKNQEKRQPSVADTAYKNWAEQINSVLKHTSDAKDKTSLKSVLKNISYEDFYEKESIEKHLQKVTAAEDAEFTKKLGIWQKRYDAIMSNPKRTQKDNDKWLKDNPKPVKLS